MPDRSATRLGVLSASLALVSLASPATAFELVQGPILQQPTMEGIHIGVTLDEVGTPTVRYGLAEDSLDGEWTAETAALRHEVALTGLEPGESYFYGIYDGEVLISDVAVLPTAVDADTDFNFIVFGDTRSRADIHQSIVNMMVEEENVRFTVQTGDLVSDGGNLTQWDDYFAIEQPLMQTVPIYPVIGNHDEENGSAENYINLFMNPPDSPDPEHYYAFDYGNVHMVVLDGHVNSWSWVRCLPELGLLTDLCFSPEQDAWLRADLEAAAENPDIDHIALAIHIGPFSSKDGRSGNPTMREYLPYFYEMGVTIIFSGHDHYYEHGETPTGTPYVITGGGGAPLYEISDPSSAPHTVIYNESTEHYILVEVEGTTMYVTSQALDGRVLDTFEVEAVPECASVDDCSELVAPRGCTEWEARCSIGSRCVADCVEPPADPEPDAGTPDVEDMDAQETDVGVLEEVALDAPSPDSSPDLGSPDTPPTPDTPEADPATEEEEESSGGGSGGGCAVAGSAPSPALFFVLLGLALRGRRR